MRKKKKENDNCWRQVMDRWGEFTLSFFLLEVFHNKMLKKKNKG